jgi:hypothetical protein
VREAGVSKAMQAIMAAALLALLGGCAAPQPWVKPYEREHFADPIMSMSRNPVADVYLEHVFETREGARGATGLVGGGCGCN